jgi:diguanylate cyclase (GGDEF)-like protein
MDGSNKTKASWIKILIVDDEAVIRDVMTDILRDEGYDVASSHGGPDAMQKVARHPYDIVIADLGMPEMGGMALLKEIKKINPQTDVIIMAGFASIESAVASMRAGAADYITKPINIDQVRIIIDKTIQKRQLLEKVKEGEFYKKLSQIDGLTELYNHRSFHTLLEQEITRAKRYEHAISLLMIDIDHFKKYNDANGHPAGDMALKKLAWLLKHNIRGHDIIARYGGEEFALLVPEKGKQEALTVANRLKRIVEETKFDREYVLPGGNFSISIGVASYPIDAQNKNELIEFADQALYQAKMKGRNRVCLYNPSLTPGGKENEPD